MSRPIPDLVALFDAALASQGIDWLRLHGDDAANALEAWAASRGIELKRETLSWTSSLDTCAMQATRLVAGIQGGGQITAIRDIRRAP